MMGKQSLQQVMKDEISHSPMKAIPFARWMELQLYHPKWGYYQQEHPILGKQGDFFTSAHVGDLFGRTLSRAFLPLIPSSQWVLVEVGPGDGRLTEQVVNGLLEQGVSPEEIELFLVETSPYLQRLQQERLQQYPIRCSWARRVAELPRRPFSLIYSNELVDAFPVHRIRLEQGEFKEIYVTYDESSDTFKEITGPFSTERLRHYIDEFSVQLYEGQAMEINLQAYHWLEEVVNWMEQGYLFTIDYGGTIEEIVTPGRKNGTIRFYQKHQLLSDPYAAIGKADVTSHVCFTSLIHWGEQLGLKTQKFQTQAAFLLEAGILSLCTDFTNLDPFSSAGRQRRAIQQLLHPYGMGEVFRVLVQAK
jgi:SAM-dependent MidA family methyltransferase